MASTISREMHLIFSHEGMQSSSTSNTSMCKTIIMIFQEHIFSLKKETNIMLGVVNHAIGYILEGFKSSLECFQSCHTMSCGIWKRSSSNKDKNLCLFLIFYFESATRLSSFFKTLFKIRQLRYGRFTYFFPKSEWMVAFRLWYFLTSWTMILNLLSAILMALSAF